MDQLATHLKRAGWSAAELARRAKTTPTLICDVRRGRKKHFSAETARRIVDALAPVVGEEAVHGLFEKLAGLPPPRRTKPTTS
jgi:predicted transcriptional regulator